MAGVVKGRTCRVNRLMGSGSYLFGYSWVEIKEKAIGKGNEFGETDNFFFFFSCGFGGCEGEVITLDV